MGGAWQAEDRIAYEALEDVTLNVQARKHHASRPQDRDRIRRHAVTRQWPANTPGQGEEEMRRHAVDRQWPAHTRQSVPRPARRAETATAGCVEARQGTAGGGGREVPTG